MSQRKVYVASSWRNRYQQDVVKILRDTNHLVYDFMHPTEGYHNPEGLPNGFQWSEIDPEWEQWDTSEYLEALDSPLAVRGFKSDWDAMVWADTCVLVLPSGRSAHIEAGYFVGAGKDLHILMPEVEPPDLMYKMATKVHVNEFSLVRSLMAPPP